MFGITYKRKERCLDFTRNKNVTDLGPYCLNNILTTKKAAFTLAETLITLGIIGIVAAITIPSLIHDYNRKVFEVRFKKADSVIAQAIKMTTDEIGIDFFDVSSKVTTTEQTQMNEMLNQAWEHQFKGATKFYIKDIGTYMGDEKNPKCWGRRGIYSFLTNSFAGNYYNAMIDNERKAYALVLQDGTMISSPRVNLSFTNSTLTILFDTNGPFQGPNRYGYDIFVYYSNPNFFSNGCNPIGGNSYSSRCIGAYQYAKKDKNPYDKSVGWWDGLYKNKSWWQELKNKQKK